MSDSGHLRFEAKLDERGGFHPVNATLVRARLAKWNGRKVSVTVERERKYKTLPQLGYYFDVVIPLWSEHAGYSEKEMHTELKLAFFPVRNLVAKLTGEEKQEIPSLKDATCEEMSLFLERVLREAAHQALFIPPARKDWTYEQVAL